MDDFLVTAIVAGLVLVLALYLMVRNTLKFMKENREGQGGSQEHRPAFGQPVRTVRPAEPTKPSGNSEGKTGLGSTAPAPAVNELKPTEHKPVEPTVSQPGSAGPEAKQAATTEAEQAKPVEAPAPGAPAEPQAAQSAPAEATAKPVEGPKAEAKAEPKIEAAPQSAGKPAAATKSSAVPQGPKEEDKKNIENVEQILSKYFDEDSKEAQ